MNKISMDQIGGALRVIVPLLFGSLVASGKMSSEQVGALTSAFIDFLAAAVTLGAIVWSVMRNTKTAQIGRVADMPEVRKVVAESHIADVALKDNRKVVTG